MSNPTKYDFDKEDKFIEFQFNGNIYQFWFPTVEQTIEMQKLEKNETAITDFMFSLVKTPEGSKQPEFKDVRDKLNVKQINMFRTMLETELGVGN